MTKVSVFGQQSTETKELKKIEFVYSFFNEDYSLKKAKSTPNQFENVMLLEKKYGELDFIMAWDKNIDDKYFYLGHWNDGIV